MHFTDHINNASTLKYIRNDEKRLRIPWIIIRSYNFDGKQNNRNPLISHQLAHGKDMLGSYPENCNSNWRKGESTYVTQNLFHIRNLGFFRHDPAMQHLSLTASLPTTADCHLQFHRNIYSYYCCCLLR